MGITRKGILDGIVRRRVAEDYGGRRCSATICWNKKRPGSIRELDTNVHHIRESGI